MVLLIPPFYAGGSMVTATILAGTAGAPDACVYAYFASAMPRSGGDYVYISRTLHPYLGFLSSWNWMVWLVTYTGIPAAYLAQYGLSGCAARLGFVFNSPRLVAYGDNFTRKWWIFAADDPAHRLFAIIFSLGTRLYFRIQNVTFVIAMTGVVVGLVDPGDQGPFRQPPPASTHMSRPRGPHNAAAGGWPSHQGTCHSPASS